MPTNRTCNNTDEALQLSSTIYEGIHDTTTDSADDSYGSYVNATSGARLVISL